MINWQALFERDRDFLMEECGYTLEQAEAAAEEHVASAAAGYHEWMHSKEHE